MLWDCLYVRGLDLRKEVGFCCTSKRLLIDHQMECLRWQANVPAGCAGQACQQQPPGCHHHLLHGGALLCIRGVTLTLGGSVVT